MIINLFPQIKDHVEKPLWIILLKECLLCLCSAVSYTDLGLEERAGDGYSTLTSHTSSINFSSPGGPADIADAIRSSFYKSICRVSFAKNLFVDECKKYHHGP